MEMSTLDRTRRRKDTDIKKVLDENFKSLFAQAGEGIPIRTLISHIENSHITQMPLNKIQQLMHMYDDNKDGLISYKEFTRLILAEQERFDLSNLTTFKRFLLEVTATTVPHSKQVDYLEQYTCKPPPLFMILISLVEVSVFIWYAVLLPQRCVPVTSATGVSIWSPMIYNPSRRYEAWRYFTYIFVHVGYVHIITNLIFQLFLGIPLEMVHGWWRILLIYICGAITGSFAHSVADGYSYLAGASGGAYSIAIAHVANVIMNWSEMQVDWFKGKPMRILLSAPVRLVLILLIAGTDTGIALYNKFAPGMEKSHVGIAAHLGGMGTGLLLGIPVLKNLDVKPWETILFWVSLIIWIVLVIFAILWNALWPGFPPLDWTPLVNSTIIPSYC